MRYLKKLLTDPALRVRYGGTLKEAAQNGSGVEIDTLIGYVYNKSRLYRCNSIELRACDIPVIHR